MRSRDPMELNAGIKIYQRIELEKWMEKMWSISADMHDLVYAIYAIYASFSTLHIFL